MNEKSNKIISFSKSESWKKFLENGISITSDIKMRLEHNPKLLNHFLRKHTFEEVQINGKTIFKGSKNQPYQIKKVIEEGKITYKVEY